MIPKFYFGHFIPIFQGSADSGRATGPLTSYSPFADEYGLQTEILPIYEFEVENTLVGLIIGVKGKTIRVCDFFLFFLVIPFRCTPLFFWNVLNGLTFSILLGSRVPISGPSK